MVFIQTSGSHTRIEWVRLLHKPDFFISVWVWNGGTLPVLWVLPRSNSHFSCQTIQKKNVSAESLYQVISHVQKYVPYCKEWSYQAWKHQLVSEDKFLFREGGSLKFCRDIVITPDMQQAWHIAYWLLGKKLRYFKDVHVNKSIDIDADSRKSCMRILSTAPLL